VPRRFFALLRVDYARMFEDRTHHPLTLFFARQVPREMRLAAIRGEQPIDDPDIGPGFGSLYFLQNAVHLLQHQDAEMLLALERQRRESRGPSATRTARPMCSYSLPQHRCGQSRRIKSCCRHCSD
jgi:hypothetical protein